MSCMKVLRVVILLGSLFGSRTIWSWAQIPVTNHPARNVLLNDVPGVVLSQVRALGDRVTRPGKEISVLSGRFLDRNGRLVEVSVTLELPQCIEIRGLKSGNDSLRFDSRSPAIPTDPDDAVLLETFTTDTAEGFLASLKDGAKAEIVGFGIVPAESQQALLPEAYDVFRVETAVKTRSDHQTRTKLYFFDSATGYLTKTRYEDGRSDVEVRFSNWHREDGSAFPGRIERYENNQMQFSFDVQSITVRPLSSDGPHQ
jgi:hypothetical protein